MTGEARKREREGCKTCERKRDERLGFDAWVYTCVCTRCQLREGRTEKERERETTMRYRRAGGEGWVANVRIVVGEGLNSLYYTP